MSNWTITCYSSFGDTGTCAVIQNDNGNIEVKQVAVEKASAKESHQRPILIGVNADLSAWLMDPISHEFSRVTSIPADCNPMYSYPDRSRQRFFFVNDGDKDGNSPLCENVGAPVYHIAKVNEEPQLIKQYCMGRGHHVTCYLHDSKRIFVSNLLDGTIDVLSDDENAQYLESLHQTNLLEANKEDDSSINIPNNAFPHGMVYSKVTNKVYNLNNGYGSVVIMNPQNGEIEGRITLKGASNLLDSPCGKYIIGKGADRKSDADHVIGKLSVIDTGQADVVTHIDIADFYPSVYRFSPDGKKLYVTSAATGKGTQRDNLKMNVVQIYDTSQLPKLVLQKEITVGKADCGRRPIAFALENNEITHILIPNPSDGSLSILDGNDEILATMDIAAAGATEPLFSFWNDNMYGG